MITKKEVTDRARCALGEWQDKYPTYRIVFASVAGSHSFGYATDKSDIDIRGAYIVPTEEFFVSEGNPPETIEFKAPEYGVEMQLHEIKKFVDLMTLPNLNMLECLYVDEDYILETSPEIVKLLAIAKDSISKATYPHICGMIIHMRKHRNKYNMTDPKKSLYIYRELMRGIVLFETSEFENDIYKLAETIGVEKVTYQVDKLISKKNDGTFLDKFEMSEVLDMERMMEARLLASKEFSPLAIRPKDDIKKRKDKYILDIRRKSYENKVII